MDKFNLRQEPYRLDWVTIAKLFKHQEQGFVEVELW